MIARLNIKISCILAYFCLCFTLDCVFFPFSKFVFLWRVRCALSYTFFFQYFSIFPWFLDSFSPYRIVCIFPCLYNSNFSIFSCFYVSLCQNVLVPVFPCFNIFLAGFISSHLICLTQYFLFSIYPFLPTSMSLYVFACLHISFSLCFPALIFCRLYISLYYPSLLSRYPNLDKSLSPYFQVSIFPWNLFRSKSSNYERNDRLGIGGSFPYCPFSIFPCFHISLSPYFPVSIFPVSTVSCLYISLTVYSPVSIFPCFRISQSPYCRSAALLEIDVAITQKCRRNITNSGNMNEPTIFSRDSWFRNT